LRGRRVPEASLLFCREAFDFPDILVRNSMNFLTDLISKGMKKKRRSMRRARIARRRPRRSVKRRPASKASQAHYALHKETTRALVASRLPELIGAYRALGIEFRPVGRVFIKNVRTRWGSCSSKGNLNFSYRLALLPARLSDYVIIHELCHLREFNHSFRFWDLVALMDPEYGQHREELKGHSLLLIDPAAPEAKIAA
jgi:predicted metal-dependent hydrolase